MYKESYMKKKTRVEDRRDWVKRYGNGKRTKEISEGQGVSHKAVDNNINKVIRRKVEELKKISQKRNHKDLPVLSHWDIAKRYPCGQ